MVALQEQRYTSRDYHKFAPLHLQLSWWWPRLRGLWTPWRTGLWWTRWSSPPRLQRRRGYLGKGTSRLSQVWSTPVNQKVYTKCCLHVNYLMFPCREDQANSRNHCCVCQCWASDSFVWGEHVWKLWLCWMKGFFCFVFFFFFIFLTHFCLEGLWGSLGGQSVWQILTSPPHFPLQRQNQRSQASDLTGRDPSVKVPYTATCGWLVKCFSLIWWCLPISVKSHLVR